MLRATGQPIETSAPADRAFLDMKGAFAEFQTKLRRERQTKGIAKAKARGVCKGRKVSINVKAARQLLAEGVRPTQIARQLSIGRTSAWRVSRPAADEPIPRQRPRLKKR